MKAYAYIAAVLILIGALTGVYFTGHSRGVDQERSRNLNAALEHEAKMSTQRRKHAEELDALVRRYAANTETANQRIRALMQTNKDLLDWWRTAVDPDAAVFAWLRPTGDNAVRSGSDADRAVTTSGEAGETHQR